MIKRLTKLFPTKYQRPLHVVHNIDFKNGCSRMALVFKFPRLTENVQIFSNLKKFEATVHKNTRTRTVVILTP